MICWMPTKQVESVEAERDVIYHMTQTHVIYHGTCQAPGFADGAVRRDSRATRQQLSDQCEAGRKAPQTSMRGSATGTEITGTLASTPAAQWNLVLDLLAEICDSGGTEIRSFPRVSLPFAPVNLLPVRGFLKHWALHLLPCCSLPPPLIKCVSSSRSLEKLLLQMIPGSREPRNYGLPSQLNAGEGE